MIPSLQATTASNPINIAIIGGGICGACVASSLSKFFKSNNDSTLSFHVDVFDQGRSGVGGRTSHRRISLDNESSNGNDKVTLGWDHGCQFFRADTPRMARVVQDWVQEGLCAEWKGKFASIDGNGCVETSFFGMPNDGPFYAGIGGMNSITKGLLFEEQSPISNFQMNVYEHTRVTGMHRLTRECEQSHEKRVMWSLSGIFADEAVFHDTSENKARKATSGCLSDGKLYDAVVLTDISSTTFESWHRASANIPADLEFVKEVKKRVGPRVPLFSCLIAFDTPLPIDIDAISFDGSNGCETPLWYACRTNHKPGFSNKQSDVALSKDCWTIVSTPRYAMQKISDTPMQDPNTGQFIPQSKDYLLSVPGPELEAAFKSALLNADKESSLYVSEGDMPETFYLDAQRWGSAMPSHRDRRKINIDKDPSSSIEGLSGVAYDSRRAPLSPSKIENQGNKELSYVADRDLMIVQAGDMVSNITPGFESAAISGMEAAEFLLEEFHSRLQFADKVF